ncbi:MAG: sugar ABC transporter substrate-binding protein [Mesorhizobium sp.]|uniref:ABC transporter substrate-binding protein n=1 Tax=unclassified Mesorhizobium TaxID=325217 RepID=UPI000FE8E782|nr:MULTISPECIES: ABC transporter substrate-binding protein [unclassified Mesorhizobium]RWB26490.1 MAG: sugar ABC transporter substrate-binding protein [Mesorhizobium sp.]RWB28393.1 MAG: sugar ABC transporter substrate-binding protein [Mesorhizobium sp.]RWB79448.1 MAG: sugar ABC transporter substrate-binding protein [Mesorhizobium sp.]RWC17232.1 MAG: sugar ABC transporter substrate-binding protein [Mesorhizobium sp.]RWD19320.1 MAG: sugar ABC transporter substrate-binding protein [Mesorhizobium 
MKKYLAMVPLLAGAAFLASVGVSSAEAKYTIGVSNTVQGNGWREEMICAIKAQALASGEITKLNIAHRNTDAAGQLEDIRNLISAKVSAIVVNPADPAGIKSALEEATKAGIVVVAVDQAVTEPSAYIISNNQEQYAYLGAKWLFQQIGGKGDVVYMRGAAGASADSDRDKGFKKALAEFPDVKVVHEVFTGWQQDQGKQQILDFIATGSPFNGIWTSGIDNVIVDALVESQTPLVPVVGADNAGFVGQLNSVEGLVGAAVTNPGSIGGAGVTLALQILNGKKPAEQTVLVEPQLWENATEEGKAKLKSVADPSLSPEWPISISIPEWTTYTKDQIIACKGPGE